MYSRLHYLCPLQSENHRALSKHCSTVGHVETLHCLSAVFCLQKAKIVQSNVPNTHTHLPHLCNIALSVISIQLLTNFLYSCGRIGSSFGMKRSPPTRAARGPRVLPADSCRKLSYSATPSSSPGKEKSSSSSSWQWVCKDTKLLYTLTTALTWPSQNIGGLIDMYVRSYTVEPLIKDTRKEDKLSNKWQPKSPPVYTLHTK